MIGDIFKGLFNDSGLSQGSWQNYVMLLVSFVLMYLAIVKKFEPLLLLPIAFGMFIINLPGAHDVLWGVQGDGVAYEDVENKGLLWYLFFGVQNVIYPPLIFLGIGAMTDFGPLISNPNSLLFGAGAQLGFFLTWLVESLIVFNLAA
ncbi:MAG: sodium ion-translocating decarboxylase subunit beta, partial [Clostridia bacterium]|nr:sodium ion-translocating decarboxylase subunit beta [Clostridia bacterium]